MTDDPDIPPGDDGRFDAAYVSTLRREAAQRRVAERVAEEALQAATLRHEVLSARLLDLEVADATRGILADPTDLLAHVPPDQLKDPDGNPDPMLIRAASEALLERKAHLAPRKAPSGDVDQGARPQATAPFDFADALRRAAQ